MATNLKSWTCGFTLILISHNFNLDRPIQTHMHTHTHTAPNGVDPPTISALSSSELQITWKEPNFPNGIIRRYGIYQITSVTSEVLIGSFSTEPGSLIVSDLLPFTEYSFLLEVCTSVDCSRSNVASERTLEGG